MKKEKRHSYGVIPVIKEGDSYRLLLINQKDTRGEYWTFAKGTPEIGESVRETALRETKEETGIEIARLDTDFVHDEEYTYEFQGETLEKIVTYYLGVPTSTDASPQEIEVHECVWMTLAEAKAKVTYERARNVIDAIERHLPHSRLF